MEKKIIEWFLRVALSASYLSAVADRFGFWPAKLSAWGNWENFLAYTKSLNFYLPENSIPVVGIIATIAEILLGIILLIPFKTNLFAKLSGVMLLVFGFTMVVAIGIKAPLDYSVFTGAAASLALSYLTKKTTSPYRVD